MKKRKLKFFFEKALPLFGYFKFVTRNLPPKKKIAQNFKKKKVKVEKNCG